ncbi:MAG: hypothetical protein AB8B55_13635 [Mariniblastus sp.]
MNLRFDSATNMNFYGQRLAPVVAGWTETNLSDGLLSTDGIRRYANSFPVSDLQVSNSDFRPVKSNSVAQYPTPSGQYSRPIAHDEIPPNAKRLNRAVPSGEVIKDTSVRVVGFQMDLPAEDARRERLREEDLIAIANADAALAKPLSKASTQGTEQDPDQEREKPAGAPTPKKPVKKTAEQEPAKEPLKEVDPVGLIAAPDSDDLKSLNAEVERQTKLVDENTTLDENTKADLKKIIVDTTQALQRAASLESGIETQKRAQREFPDTVASIRESLDSKMKSERPSDDLSSDQIKTQLLEKRQKLQQLKTDLANKESQIEKRDGRIQLLPELRTKADETVSQLEKKLASLAVKPEETKAQLELLRTRARLIEATLERESLENEALRQEQVGTILPMQRDNLIQNLSSLELEVSIWESEMNKHRESETKEQLADAKKKYDAAVSAAPALKKIAEHNKRLADTRIALTELMKTRVDEAKKVSGQHEKVTDRLSDLKQKFDDGIMPSNGTLLADLRESKLQPYRSQARIQEINSVLRQIRLNRAILQNEQETIVSAAQLVDRLVVNNDIGDKPEAKEMATDLARTKIEYLKQVEKDYEGYTTNLTEVQRAHMTLINKMNELGEFIYENALWIQSVEPLDSSDFKQARFAVGDFFGDKRNQWSNLFSTLTNRVINGKYATAFFGFLLLSVFVVSRRLRGSNE